MTHVQVAHAIAAWTWAWIMDMRKYMPRTANTTPMSLVTGHTTPAYICAGPERCARGRAERTGVRRPPAFPASRRPPRAMHQIP